MSQSQLLIDVFRAFEKREQRLKVKPKSNAMRMTFGKYIGQPLDQIPRVSPMGCRECAEP